MNIKYYANFAFCEIKRIEIVLETNKTVLIRHKLFSSKGLPCIIERKKSKETSDYSYSNTWKEAHDWMMKKAMDDVKHKQYFLKLSNDRLEEIEKMTNNYNK